MPRPHQPAANSGSLVVTPVNNAWARSRSPREPVRTMNELSSARACRYSSLTGPGSEASLGPERGASIWSPALRPCSAANTSLEISVCTAIRSSEATRIAPPERTLCELTSSSCQFKSNPCSERKKFPASTNETSSFCPIESGSICAIGSVISVLDGRTTSAGIRARRAAIASASATPYSGATSVYYASPPPRPW